MIIPRFMNFYNFEKAMEGSSADKIILFWAYVYEDFYEWPFYTKNNYNNPILD